MGKPAIIASDLGSLDGDFRTLEYPGIDQKVLEEINMLAYIDNDPYLCES